MPCIPKIVVLVQRFSGKLQESHVAGSFHCYRDPALMFGTVAGLPSRADFSFPIHKIGKELGISIIDFKLGIGAELAGSWAGIVSPATSASSAAPASRATRHSRLLIKSFYD